MEQYIDKAALVAEIEKLYNGEIDTYTRNILDRLKSNIDTLEVKEVGSNDKGEWKNTGGFGSTCDPDSPDYCPD